MPSLLTINAGADYSQFQVKESALKVQDLLKVAGANKHPSIVLHGAIDGADVTISVRAFVSAVDV